MCRNITTLRGLEPAATDEEVLAAAQQFVRKVSGIPKLSQNTQIQCFAAAEQIAAITRQLLVELPRRRQPPNTEPPLRRLGREQVG
jgi:hypothetical protein